jgi:putative acetyltransferase
MPIKVREMQAEHGRRFLEVHRAAVRGIAAKDYPTEVIEDWAGLPVTEQSIERFLSNPDDEIRLVAEIGGVVVGIGCLVAAKCDDAWLASR